MDKIKRERSWDWDINNKKVGIYM